MQQESVLRHLFFGFAGMVTQDDVTKDKIEITTHYTQRIKLKLLPTIPHTCNSSGYFRFSGFSTFPGTIPEIDIL
jgi:hypothetical protein